MISSVKIYVKFLLKVFKSLRYDFEEGSLASMVLLQLPEGINMNANDICNSKCVMCNIWKQTLDFEFSPEQLFTITQRSFISQGEICWDNGWRAYLA